MKTKKYTKTQLKKDQTAMVIETLQDEFGARNFDNDQGSYFTFNIGDFTGLPLPIKTKEMHGLPGSNALG